MLKAKCALKGFFAMLFCGLATISLSPSSNYSNLIPANSTIMTKESWEMTGTAMKHSINKVGERLGNGI